MSPANQHKKNIEAVSALRMESTIPYLADTVACSENIAAIDRAVKTDKYHHIIAWGKWLGFSPATVSNSIEIAVLDNAPADAIQKIDGIWLRLADIVNESNRSCVRDLAHASRRGT